MLTFISVYIVNLFYDKIILPWFTKNLFHWKFDFVYILFKMVVFYTSIFLYRTFLVLALGEEKNRTETCIC